MKRQLQRRPHAPLQLRLRPSSVALLLAFAPFAAQAQVATPSAGTILQQVQQSKPAAALPAGTGLTIEKQDGAKSPPSAPFMVNKIDISGSTTFDAATLHALVADSEGKSLSLDELGNVVGRISDFYHNHGYPLARAIIPAQTIRDGIVHVMVIEARYGQIKLDNHSSVNSSLLQQTLAPLQAGQTIAQGALDHTLLLVSDIPGVSATSVLKPGDAVGTSDLEVQTAVTAPFGGSVTVDNTGNRFTGRTRLGATVNAIDPLQHGDVLSAGVLTTGSDMNYGSVSYETLLNGLGTRVGGSYSGLHYTLGDTLTAIKAHGTADVASVWVKHPFIRTPSYNLYGQLQFDDKQLDDRVDASGIDTKRHLDNWSATVNGDWRTTPLAGGAGTWSLGATAGKVDFDNASAGLADASTAKTRGGFTKWLASGAYLQNLSTSDALYVSVSGQTSNGNLDASEKMVAGGPYSVRAYDVGALSGDTGVLASVEWRHALGQLWGGQWQVTGFVDSEHVTINKTPWLPGDNSATLSGAGLGLNWYGAGQWHAKLFVATPIGDTPALLAKDSKSTRAWAEVGLGF